MNDSEEKDEISNEDCENDEIDSLKLLEMFYSLKKYSENEMLPFFRHLDSMYLLSTLLG